MSKIEINKLTNANIYMNSTNLLGRAEEVQLPQIKIIKIINVVVTIIIVIRIPYCNHTIYTIWNLI